MFVLIFLAILGALIASCTIYAATKAVSTDIIIRRDHKKYNEKRIQLLEEITTHLKCIKDDNNSKESSDAISALGEIARYIRNY